ncbi:hypothetical protein [Palaeococcus ferrophilus]|uniref:hypothetical protein n=1 Tax=Palaeococcus ferrophilus TaxID=83868 RepID=UPI00064F38A9|nr:hypothetical protein [Palaeococcus ferrophilus]
MLAEEVLESVEIIRDPELKAITYSRLGHVLAVRGSELSKTAFKRALDTIDSIEDPVGMMRALAAVAYYTGKAGMRTSKKLFQRVRDGLEVFPPEIKDVLLSRMVMYLVDLGEIDEAVYHALEISDRELRNDILILALRKYLARIVGEPPIKALQMRKAEYIWERVEGEPYYSIATVELVKAYLRLEEYDRAIYFTKFLKNKFWIRQVLREIIIHLKAARLSKAYYDKLVAVAIDLSENLGEDITRDLVFIFALNGEFENAFSLLRNLPDMEETLVKLTEGIVSRRPELLEGYFELMPADELAIAGRAFLNYLIDSPRLEFEPVVDGIVARTLNEKVLVKAVSYYLKIGRLDKAAGVAAAIKDPEISSLAFSSVAHYLLRQNRVEDAIDLVTRIEDRRLSEPIIAELLVKVLESGEE